MFWKNLLYSFREKKLKKGDIIFIILLSLLMSVLTCFIMFGFLGGSEKNSSFSTQFLGDVIIFPSEVNHRIIEFFRPSGSDYESMGTALGNGLMAGFLSPVSAFVLWGLIFYFLTKINIIFFEAKNFGSRNFVSLLIFSVFFLGYFLFMGMDTIFS